MRIGSHVFYHPLNPTPERLLLADSSGIVGQVGGDLGVRVLIHGTRRFGVGILAVVTPGALVVSLVNGGSVAGFHFGALFGFDFSAFTLQPTVGPGVAMNRGFVGLFESTLDLGVRF